MVKATGTPIPWEDGIEHLKYVRSHGIDQFLKLYHELKEIGGDKVRATSFSFEHKKNTVFIIYFLPRNVAPGPSPRASWCISQRHISASATGSVALRQHCVPMTQRCFTSCVSSLFSENRLFFFLRSASPIASCAFFISLPSITLHVPTCMCTLACQRACTDVCGCSSASLTIQG